MIKLGFYKLVAFSSIHNQVLYRLTEEKEKGNINFDLLFEGTEFINLPISIDIKKIYIKNNNLNRDEISQQKKKIIIEFSDGEGLIISQRVKYQTNNLKPMESSIPSDREEPLTDEKILEIFNNVKEGGLDYVNENFGNNDWKVII